jgi:thiol:disulfide interchange protein DsbD
MTQSLSDILASYAGGLNLWQAVLAIILAYFGGVLSSLTPCVYPMIPTTVSVVSGLGLHRTRWKEICIRGLTYVAGMAIVYSTLGVLAGLTGRIFGSLTNTPNWYFGIGLIMNVAALIMLEVIPFDPATWWDQLKRKVTPRRTKSKLRNTHPQRREMTLLGSFFLGASSGFVAAPCTTPVLTAILAYIAKSQSVGLGCFLMLSYSLGLGTLLLVIAAFAGAIQVLPRTGQWMKTIKIGSGLILLAFAEYLIYRAGSLGGP